MVVTRVYVFKEVYYLEILGAFLTVFDKLMYFQYA